MIFVCVHACLILESTAEEMPLNNIFTREHTLFLIDLMRDHLLKDEADLPTNLKELNNRVRMARGRKRWFWKEMADKLTQQFKMRFEVEKVARKWTTLEEGYKKAVDNNNSTGKAPTKFQFYKEMGELLGGQHDIDFPVVGTAKGVVVRRPEAIKPTRQPFSQIAPCNEEGECSSSDNPSSPLPNSEGTPTSHPPSARKRKRGGEDSMSQVITCFRECEVAAQRRHDEMMQQIKNTNDLFRQMLQNAREQQ